jgi:2'-5' RNA ligase
VLDGNDRPPSQMLLPGVEPEPVLDQYLFIAVLPEPQAARKIANEARRLRKEHRLLGMPSGADRFHISLCGTGMLPDIPEGLVKQICQAASAIRLSPFTVSFDRALSFSGKSHARSKRAFVLRSSGEVSGLIELHQTLARALATLGWPISADTGLTPHITLLYDQQSVAEQPVNPIEWTVREVVLVHGRVGQPYVIRGRWQLHD